MTVSKNDNHNRAEEKTRNKLIEHFKDKYGDRVSGYVESLLQIDHYIGRFQYFSSVVKNTKNKAPQKILISGCGAGSEMLAAHRLGYRHIAGVEVDNFWIDICRFRLQSYPDMSLSYYPGDYLSYQDNTFDLIASGHVIEHTADPSLYIKELLRVIKPGGYISLEYPTRYHYKELHTNLVSFEWLPEKQRNYVIRLLTGRFSPLKQETKARYLTIVNNSLQQISMHGIKKMLVESGMNSDVIHKKIAAPGIVRCIIQKKS